MAYIKSSFFFFVLSLLLSFPFECLYAKQECCSSLMLEADTNVHKIQGERLGFYSQLGYYGARPAYRQLGGNFFIFYFEDEQKWIDSKYFFGASLFFKLENYMDGYCLDESNNWSFYNGSDLMYSEVLTADCEKIEDVCCNEIEISSSNSEVKTGNQSFYHAKPKDSLGNYKAIGMNNGRYVYQKKNHDMFLEYGSRGYWLVSSGVGKSSGNIHHHWGSVCPEHTVDGWQISGYDEDGNWVWKDDPKLNIECVGQKKDLSPKHSPHETGPVAQPYIQPEPFGQSSSYSATAVVFGCLTMLLMFMMIGFFSRRFYRAWGRGAHGKQLLFETMDIE